MEKKKRRSERKCKYIGLRFGRLTVLREDGKTQSGQLLWRCLCDCGTEKSICHGNLSNGHTTSCGCFHKEQINNYNKTKTLSAAAKAKISLFFKGRPSGRKGIFKHSPETIEKLRLLSSGRKPSIEARAKLSESNRGEKSHLWKGGVNNTNDTIRKSLNFKLWREAVYERDGWICQNCHKKGGRLNPHHIKAFSLFPGLRFEVSNGMTLCQKCHKELHQTDVPRLPRCMAGLRTYEKGKHVASE